MKNILALILALILAIYAEDDEYKHITCGSAFKLIHIGSGYHVSSSQISWGSGSHLQAITAVKAESSNPSSLWKISNGINQPDCLSGTVVKCGDIVTLKHVNTRKYLRTSNHRAPLSGRKEVSGDDGKHSEVDNWRIDCIKGSAGTPLTKTASFKLVNVQHKTNLFTRIQDQFNNQNCRGCPIVDHLEMSASANNDMNSHFKIGDGFFLPIDLDREIHDYSDFSAPADETYSAKDEL